MKPNLKSLILFVFISLLLGCKTSHVIPLNDIPTRVGGMEKKESLVIVRIGDRLSNLNHKIVPSTYAGSAHSFSFVIGPSLKKTLLNSVGSVYERAFENGEAIFSDDDNDIYVNFYLSDSRGEMLVYGSGVSSTYSLHYNLTVIMEVTDKKNNETVRSYTLSGSSNSHASQGLFSDIQTDTLGMAVDNSIRQVADQATNFLLKEN
tara:strand:+ start:3597 stop:4211 length:615 start_codon:yes stop_codon:yes gene_type:complete